MKLIRKSVALVALSSLLLTACSTSSRFAVSERPVAPVYVRPAPPYPGAIWLDGEWGWQRGRYEYIRPHYVHPRRGRSWAPGYWRTSPRGNVWMKGHWRR